MTPEERLCGACWRGGDLSPTCQRPAGHPGDHRAGLFRWRDEAPPPLPSYTCPRCGLVSYNPNDLRERYCGRCHLFEEP